MCVSPALNAALSSTVERPACGLTGGDAQMMSATGSGAQGLQLSWTGQGNWQRCPSPIPQVSGKEARVTRGIGVKVPRSKVGNARGRGQRQTQGFLGETEESSSG